MYGMQVISDVKRTGQTWKASDVWSLGCLAYLLVIGFPPFRGADMTQILFAVRRAKYGFPRCALHCECNQHVFCSAYSYIDVSKPFRLLIASMLQPDPSKRITASEALNVSR